MTRVKYLFSVSLGDAVAALNVRKAEERAKLSEPQLLSTPFRSSNPSIKRNGDYNKENIPVSKAIRTSRSMETVDESLQSIIEKMHTSLEVCAQQLSS